MGTPDSSLPPNQLNQDITQALFEQREIRMSHLALDREYLFFHAIKNGDSKEVLRLMEPLTNDQLGTLSDNPVNNLRYHLIITIALTTRFCIEAGLDSERAYTLSDIYIRRADHIRTTNEITKLHREVILEFTKIMRQIKKEQVTSLPVLKVYQYVEAHLHEKINLDAMSEELHITKNYLCGLFKKETGRTIGGYITEQKINTAKELLAYTDYTLQEISSYLAYSSMSHFIKVFHSSTGLTPSGYRQANYSKHFKNT
ncbi:MAG: helix-turn-helix domain-containing protein [Lachnospiraceae bacterium]|nr:helix-turn-helix domain-containing protein [Lachnospiraceae bacterium]MBR1567571.1 helix-turn-helix domain-containing protein [Lachnospiraceae bacterium]